MANFNSMILTNKGQVLYAKGQAGKVINFTKIAVGIGSIGNTDPQTLTALVNHKYDIAIQGKTVNTAEKVALISGTLTNENMTDSVYIQEIGLYAQDPDEGEILYSYASTGEYGDYTSPAVNGPYSWNYQVYAAIGNAANVTVTLSNLQYDTGIVNTNTTFSIIKGSNQKDINKSIDNKLKPYPTTNNDNIYSISSLDIDTLTDGYPILVRFNTDSTGDISLKVNGSDSYDVIDYFNNKVSNVREGLIAHLVFDASNENFQLLGKGGDGNATSDVLVSPYTATTVAGPVTGTLADNYNTDNIEAAPTVSGTTLKLTIPTTARYRQGYHLQTTDSEFIASNILSTANLFGLQGSATIQSLGGAKFTRSSFTRAGFSSYTVNLDFTPNFVMIIQNDGGLINIRQTVFPWFYSDLFAYKDSIWYTSSQQAGNSGQPTIVFGTNSFTWQATGSTGGTYDYIAFQF